MHIYYPYDPRVRLDGCWAATGIIESCTEDEIIQLNNFLNSFLMDSRLAEGRDSLKNAFRINDEANRVYVSFQHAHTLLNFFDTMGWTYHIRGEKID